MIRSILIAVGSAIALAGCASLTAPKGPETAAAVSCPHDAPKLGPNACRPVGRSYSAEQLRRTGQTNLAQALQMLDPSISASGGP